MKKTFAITFFLFSVPAFCLAAGFDRDLFSGMRHDADVSRLQKFLQGQGLFGGEATGNFFALTQAAVKKFQEREHIAPARGYFGAKSRRRANEIMGPSGMAPASGTAAPKIAANIQALQSQMKMMQDKLAQEQAASTSLASATSTPAATTTPTLEIPAPAFTVAPHVTDAGFVSDSPFSAHYPYRVLFDWATDVQGVVQESVSCAPGLNISTPAGHATRYFAEPHTTYSCAVVVKNQAGKQTSAGLSFSTPGWVSMAGSSTAPFPDVAVTPFKIGEFTVYNGTTSDILLSSIDSIISEAMDSTPNRNHKVSFLLRDGTTTYDALISQTDFTFVSAAPQIGSANRSVLSLPLPLTLKSGEERRVSVWVEQMNYVKSGTLEIAATKLNTTAVLSTIGTFDLFLTRAPGL